MQTDKIPIGLVGYGYWGKILFKTLQASPHFKVAKIVVNCPSKPHPDTENVPISNSLSLMLDDPAIQAIVVATPPASHYAIGRAVLESGRCLLMEKTFTETADQARALKALAEEKNTHILVDYTFTFSKAVALMLQMAAQGEIGQVRAANLSMRQHGRFVGESVYSLLGSHMLSLLHKLFPLGELVFQRQDLFSRGGIVETGELRFRNSTGSFNGSIALSLNFPGKERKFTIYGEKGALMYDMLAAPPLSMGLYWQNALVEIPRLPNFNEGNNLAFVIDHFHGMLMGSGPSNIGTALAVTACLENILQGRSL